MFQHIGSEMGIRDIFDSYEEAEKYMLEYEDKFMRFSPKNVILAESSVAVALKLFPSCLHGCIKHVLHTLAGPALRSAMVRTRKSKECICICFLTHRIVQRYSYHSLA